MTTITAKTILRSSAIDEVPELTTMQLRFPRFILAEFNTHRVMSKNARSSRAVPVATMIREIEEDPVIPLHWGKNQKGMKADEECNEELILDYCGESEYHTRENGWLLARDRAVDIARRFMEAGYHKQVVNRLLEPFMHIDVLVTSTEWDNFLMLRDHPDAEPHMQILAREIRRELEEGEVTKTDIGDWHLPYVSVEEKALYDVDTARKLSTARCARISYAPFDGDGSIASELKRYELLVGSEPRHSSPAEHQAIRDVKIGGEWVGQQLNGNFRHWCQFRRYLDLGINPA